MKYSLKWLLRRVAFSFGILYGINVILNSVGVNIPINIITVITTIILGVPGILSIFAILLMI